MVIRSWELFGGLFFAAGGVFFAVIASAFED